MLEWKCKWGQGDWSSCSTSDRHWMEGDVLLVTIPRFWTLVSCSPVPPLHCPVLATERWSPSDYRLFQQLMRLGGPRSVPSQPHPAKKKTLRGISLCLFHFLTSKEVVNAKCAARCKRGQTHVIAGGFKLIDSAQSSGRSIPRTYEEARTCRRSPSTVAPQPSGAASSSGVVFGASAATLHRRQF